tara:strand:- start:169 stop:594 length:426 start_codon:yes stop_codon:yes gene_type:complete
MDNQKETKYLCPCCTEKFSTDKIRSLHVSVFHPWYKVPDSRIGKKYTRIVKQIERCFIDYRKKNISIVTLSDVEHWMHNNTRSGLAKRRISSLLKRRKQFVLHKKARRKNSNQMEYWWSLGESEEEPNTSGYEKWVDVPID